jgi:VWFA-related protein
VPANPFRCSVVIAAFLVLPGGSAGAQAPDKPKDVPTFGVTTELAYVRFHVDRKGGPASDLKPEDFRILEDGRPQKIALLEAPSTRERSIPPEVTLVIDVSGSVMDARLLDETLIKDVFIAGLSDQTTVGLCAFGGALRCLAPPTRDFRTLFRGFEDAVAFSHESRRQGTRLYASIVDICNEAAKGEKAQRALVIFSDGLENKGGKVDDAIRAAAEADMRVYAVKLSQAFQDTPNLRGGGPSYGGAGAVGPGGGFGNTGNRAVYDYKKFDLDKLAGETGGRAYEPGTIDQKSLAAILRGIATEISTEYILGYQPEDAASGRKRRVKVELADKSIGKVRDGERTLLR